MFFLTAQAVCFGQTKWELKRSEEGISVYTRKLDNDRYKEVKVSCETNGTAEKLIEILQDVKHHKDWVYGTKSAHIVSRKSRDTLVYYTEVDLPWPVSNRDLVVQLSYFWMSAKVLKVEAKSFPEMLPKKPNLVRIPYSRGLWNVVSLPGNRLKIEYEFSVNPGGALPAWLVNYTASTGPLNTFKKLRERLVED
jgi:hypothetical protein